MSEKPTERITKTGYIDVKIKGRWRPKHRVVAERCMGRRLARTEVVHHIDGNPQNNDPENLMVFATAGDHRQHHRGKTVEPVWSGQLPERSIRARVIKIEPVRWRELEWFQGKLKVLTAKALQNLKRNIIRCGLADGFRIWEDPDGKRWIQDGHQRKRALEELERDGWQVPDVVEGIFIDCADEREAANLVLAYSSVYGQTGGDMLREFCEQHKIELTGLRDMLQIPKVDVDRLRETLAAEQAPEAVLDKFLRDSRPSAEMTIIRLKDPGQAGRVIAWLNRDGIEYEVSD